MPDPQIPDHDIASAAGRLDRRAYLAPFLPHFIQDRGDPAPNQSRGVRLDIFWGAGDLLI